MREIEKKQKDKIEQVKQQIQEIQTVFDSRLKPKKNHTLFEVNLVEKTIVEAIFDTLPELNWNDAVKGLYSSNKKITKKENCIYISALNKKNVIKILKREYKINLHNQN